MGKRLIPPEEHGEVQEIALREALEERYLAYALSTIMHRALPDARDGLKPFGHPPRFDHGGGKAVVPRLRYERDRRTRAA